jgi:cell division septum initiation protein DivIVA
MATATEMITALEDQVLETVKQTQDAVLKAVQTWAEAGKNIVPELPPLPFSDQLPAAHEIVENAFQFADRLLKAQREFANAVLEAAKPVLATKNGSPAPASKATSTSKTTSA